MPRKKKSVIDAEELQKSMTKNQVPGETTLPVLTEEQILQGDERFNALSKEEQEEVLAKAKALAAPPKKKSKRKQNDLPGIEGKGVAPVQIPEVEDAAEEYVKARDIRQEWTKLEISTKERLIAAMHTHSLLNYSYDDKIVRLKPKDAKETVKVETVKPDENDIDIDEE